MKHALFLLALALSAQAQAQTQLRRDPFARPALPAKTEAAVALETQAPPQLRAIMVAPGRSLANIDGQSLARGEWFGDYQLIKVDERSVTLVKHGVRRVLALDETGGK